MPLEVSYSNRPFAAARKSLYIKWLQRETCQLKTAVRENFAWLNRFTLSLLKQHPGKDSIVMKRRGCGWNENFMLEVLTGATL